MAEPTVLDERRRIRRQLCNQLALIVTADGDRHNCMVRDISRLGALLLVADEIDIPAEFSLESGSQKRDARVAWRARCRLGVAFR